MLLQPSQPAFFSTQYTLPNPARGSAHSKGPVRNRINRRTHTEHTLWRLPLVDTPQTTKRITCTHSMHTHHQGTGPPQQQSAQASWQSPWRCSCLDRAAAAAMGTFTRLQRPRLLSVSTNVCLVHPSSSGSDAERTNLLCRALGTLSSGAPQGRPPNQPSNKNACSS